MILKPLSKFLAPSEAVAPATVSKPRDPTPEELSVEFKDDPEVVTEPEVTPAPKAQTDSPTSPAPKEEKPVKEEKKEVKPILPPSSAPTKPVTKKVQDGPIMPPSATPKQRDLTGFTEEEQRVLKAMSNEAFEYTSKIIKEHKELSQLKNTQFYQSPDAYVLDPQFRKLQEDIDFAGREANYWQEQLINISDGKEWAPITGWTQDGRPVAGPTQKPTKLAEEQVRVAMNQCFGMAQQNKVNLQTFVNTHKQRIQQDEQSINQELTRRFGWVADPKLMDSKVNTGDAERSIKEIHQDFVELFPPYQRNTTGVNVAAHLFVALQIFGQKIRELENGQAVEQIKEEETTRVEPTSKQKPVQSDNPYGPIKEFSLEGLPE